MASFHAVAATARSLERLLNGAFDGDEPIAGQTTRAVVVRSEDFDLGVADNPIVFPALSIFLYRVAVNGTMRAAWAASAQADGRAHLPLDLHFLLTPWADNAEWEHLILGRTLQALQDNPVLTGPLLVRRRRGRTTRRSSSCRTRRRWTTSCAPSTPSTRTSASASATSRASCASTAPTPTTCCRCGRWSTGWCRASRERVRREPLLGARGAARARRRAMGVVRDRRLRVPLDVVVERPRGLVLDRHDSLRTLVHGDGVETSVQLLVADASRRVVPRRVALPFPPLADVLAAEAAGADLPLAPRVRRLALFPGAAYDLSTRTTALRGRVVEPGGAPLRWARVEAAPPGGATRWRAHGDDRGEFLLVRRARRVEPRRAAPRPSRRRSR